MRLERIAATGCMSYANIQISRKGGKKVSLKYFQESLTAV
jgi:hypothetical protein